MNCEHKRVSLSGAPEAFSQKAPGMPADLPPDRAVETMPYRRLMAFAGGCIAAGLIIYLLVGLLPRIAAI